MPNISTFNAPDLTIRPSEIGVESTAAAGRRLGVYGNQIAASREQTGALVGRGIREAGDAAYQQIEHHEISAGAAHGAELIATLNQSWNDTAKNADPNDTTIAAKWREETLNPALDQFRSGFLTQGGQQWAEHLVDNYRQHAFTKTAADMSSLAGDAAHVNANKTLNGLTTAAFNDPSTVNFAKDTLAHSLDGIVASSPNLSPADAGRVKTEMTLKGEEQIVKAAIMGTIVKGGDWHSIANDPKNAPYVNAPEIQQFERAERTAQNIDRADARATRAENDYNSRLQVNRTLNQMTLETIPENPGDPPRPIQNFKQRMNDLIGTHGADLERGAIESMIAKQEALTQRLGKPEPLAGISHASTMSLLNDIRSGKMATTDDIYKAYGDNKLNNADFNFLTKEFAERKTPEGERLDKDRELFFKRFSLQFDPGMGLNEKTAGNLYIAEMAARQKEAEVRAAGGDPHSVYDPNSPNFFGKWETIQKYKVPLQQQLQQLQQRTPQATLPPERPKNFPPNAQWDANNQFWFVIQNGKKFRVDAVEH